MEIPLIPCSHPCWRVINSQQNSNSKLCYSQQSVGQSLLVSSTHLGPKTRFLLLSDSCGFVDVWHPLWQEEGSVVYSCCWSSPVQSFLVPWPYFTVSDSRLLQPGGRGPHIYVPQKQLFHTIYSSIINATKGYSRFYSSFTTCFGHTW
jgi:hypothetical protein